MAYDEEVAAVLRERLTLLKAIDDSAELSFMESAGFRLEFFTLVKRFDEREMTATEMLTELFDLQRRVLAVIDQSR